MTRYFSIAVEGLSALEETKLAEGWRGYGWWHGVGNFWLLRDHTDTMTAGSVRDNIRALAPSARVIVLDVNPNTWSASAMTQSNRDWLEKYWPPEGN